MEAICRHFAQSIFVQIYLAGYNPLACNINAVALGNFTRIPIQKSSVPQKDFCHCNDHGCSVPLDNRRHLQCLLSVAKVSALLLSAKAISDS